MSMSQVDRIVLAASNLHGNGRSVMENVHTALEIEKEVHKQIADKIKAECKALGRA